MDLRDKKTANEPWQIKGFFFTDRLIRRFYSFILALHQGFWLGLLDKDSITQLIDKSYDLFEHYRADDYLYSGLFPWEKYCIDTYFRNCQTILVGAAGGGREILALNKIGYKADGFDCNRQMIEKAQALFQCEQIECHYEYSLPNHVPDNLGVYDGLIMGWAGYSHVVGERDRVGLLKELRQHVRPGGMVLISFFAINNYSYSFKTTYAIGQLIRKIRFSGENLQLGDSLVEFYLHYFTRDEIESEITKANFDLIYYSGSSFGHAVVRAA